MSSSAPSRGLLAPSVLDEEYLVPLRLERTLDLNGLPAGRECARESEFSEKSTTTRDPFPSRPESLGPDYWPGPLHYSRLAIVALHLKNAELVPGAPGHLGQSVLRTTCGFGAAWPGLVGRTLKSRKVEGRGGIFGQSSGDHTPGKSPRGELGVC